MPRTPYTLEELRAIAPKLQKKIETVIDEFEALYPETRPVPPLTIDEARELLLNLIDATTERILTHYEVFLAGQLLSQYTQALRGELLTGKKGRYYVISEIDLKKLQGQNNG